MQLLDQEKDDIYRDKDKARWRRLHILEPLFDKIDDIHKEDEKELTFIDEDPFHIYFDDKNGERLRLRKYHREPRYNYIKFMFDEDNQLLICD